MQKLINLWSDEIQKKIPVNINKTRTIKGKKRDQTNKKLFNRKNMVTDVKEVQIHINQQNYLYFIF